MVVASVNPVLDGGAVLDAVRIAARESQVGSVLLGRPGGVVLQLSTRARRTLQSLRDD